MKVRTTVYLDCETHVRGMKMAKADRRAFSKFIEVEIERLWQEREGKREIARALLLQKFNRKP